MRAFLPPPAPQKLPRTFLCGFTDCDNTDLLSEENLMRSEFRIASVSNFVCLLLALILISGPVVPLAVVVQATTVAERITDASSLRGPVSRRSPRSAPADKPEHRSGELLVRFRNTTGDQQRAITLAAHGLRPKQRLRGESGVERFEVSPAQNIER